MKPTLSSLSFFRDASAAALALLEEEGEWFSLPGGWPLFLAGEPPDGLYFVVSGALAAFQGEGSGMAGYIRAGEPVGEMALLAGEAHGRSVYALRDSEILKLSPELFDRLTNLHPELMKRIARLMLVRTRPSARRLARAEPKVFSLISTSPTIDIRLRARTLVDALRALGKKACVVGAEEGGDKPSVWFDALEREHDTVFLISPIADSSWFRTCLRQADRIWVLARADAAPSVPLFPEESSGARQLRLVDVVLLHHGSDRAFASAEQWRRACDAQRIFHWHGLADRDGARLARMVAGRSIGLVLSGGGARAYAHIGVIRALREAGHIVDVVGGTSMGAIVGACLAMGWDDDEIESRIRRAFVDSNPLGDYVLPVVALSRGRRVEHRLHEHFGDTLIEDLELPFYCVSTNLVNGSVRVHRSGLLRDALRATISLPGILPPVVDGAQALLVDGAVLKNFPVDIMRETHRGPIIGVDVARRSTIDPQQFVDAPDFIGWVTRRGFQSAPPIGSLLMRSATLSIDTAADARNDADVVITPVMADVDLRDWKKFESAIAAGYEATVAALKESAFGEHHGVVDASAAPVAGSEPVMAERDETVMS